MSRGLLETERRGWNPSSVTSSKLPNLAAAEPLKWGRNAHLERLLCKVPKQSTCIITETNKTLYAFWSRWQAPEQEYPESQQRAPGTSKRSGSPSASAHV